MKGMSCFITSPIRPCQCPVIGMALALAILPTYMTENAFQINQIFLQVRDRGENEMILFHYNLFKAFQNKICFFAIN